MIFRAARASFKRQRAEEAGNGEKDGEGCVHSGRSEQLPQSVNSNKDSPDKSVIKAPVCK